MDILVDIILDLLFDGVSEAAFSKRSPRWLRLLCGILLLAGAAVVSGAILYIGIRDRNMLICAAGAVIAVIFAAALVQAVRKNR